MQGVTLRCHALNANNQFQKKTSIFFANSTLDMSLNGIVFNRLQKVDQTEYTLLTIHWVSGHISFIGHAPFISYRRRYLDNFLR